MYLIVLFLLILFFLCVIGYIIYLLIQKIEPYYGDYMNKRLTKLKKEGYGKPPGKLRYEPNKEHCYTKYNLLPSHNVAFKSLPYGTGCIYLDNSF